MQTQKENNGWGDYCIDFGMNLWHDHLLHMAKTYFLHGAGAIWHMLLMAWGREPTSNIGHHKDLQCGIPSSTPN